MRVVVIVIALFLVGCSREEAWVGRYVGTLMESSQVSRLEGGSSTALTDGQSTNNEVVTLAKSGEEEITATTPRGTIKLKTSGENSAEVIPKQYWQVTTQGYQGRMLMTGQAILEHDKLNLILAGTAQEPNHSGSYAFTFNGDPAKE